LPFVLAGLSLTPAIAAAAEVEVSPGDDLEGAMNALMPGDTLILHEGMYELTDRFGATVIGTEDMPITIRNADGEVAHIHRATANENIVDFDAAEYVVIRGIVFSGGSAGVRFSASRFVTFEDNEIYGTADVALRANDGATVYEGFQILRNHIHDTDGTGEGMYLGCNENACQFTGALIEGNYVHHTNADTVSQGDGIEIKEGSSDNIIRDNVIHDTNYPCILTYANAGNGGVNTIERNVMWNCGDHGIQTAADAIIRNNIILSAVANGIAMQSHQSGAPANLEVVHNTVLHASDHAVRIGDIVGTVVIANNALYSNGGNAVFVAGGDTSMTTVVGNVGVGGVSGIDATIAMGDIAVDFAAGSYAGAPPMDLFPAAGGALVGVADVAYPAGDDFNCLAREGSDVGAYGFVRGGNPGWTLQAGFKSCTGGGSDDTTGGDDDTSDTVGDETVGEDTVDADGSSDSLTSTASSTMTAGSSATATADDSGGSDGSGAADDDGDKGCGCSATPHRASALMLLVVAFARRRRR
jgi:MYXO-CTERM domain-containing protein